MNKHLGKFLLTIGLPAILAVQSFANPTARSSVMVQAKDDVSEEKNKTKNGGTQTISIDITISGKAINPESRVIKWTTYGKDQKSGDIVMMETGEIPVNFGSGTVQKAASKKMTSTYKEKQPPPPQKAGSRGPAPKAIPGDGVRYFGYVVEVLEGGAVIGSKYDPRTLEKRNKPEVTH